MRRTHSSVNGTGTVGWHYDISDGLLDFLGDDDQLDAHLCGAGR